MKDVLVWREADGDPERIGAASSWNEASGVLCDWACLHFPPAEECYGVAKRARSMDRMLESFGHNPKTWTLTESNSDEGPTGEFHIHLEAAR